MTGLSMTGQELHQLLVEKWGYSYDVQLRRVQGKVVMQIMWKYLEQVSFPMSETEYLAHLDEVASYLVAWNSVSQVKEFITVTRERPRLGKAVTIPIDLGERASEWILEEF